jgi:hypothetical protein
MTPSNAIYPPVILEGVPRIGYNVHMSPFPGALFACMKYLSDPCDYDYLMGVSGAAFRRLWNRDDGGNVDLSYLGEEPFRRSFQALGYDWQIVPVERDAMVQAIKESIARGVPAISFGIIGPPEAGIVAGYQGEGERLFGWSYFQEDRDRYYEKADWFETMDKGADKGLIILGAKRASRPAPRELLVSTLEWAIDLTRTISRPMLPNHVAGLAAYDAWAAALEVDADYPADDGQIMEVRVMVYGDQVTMLYERYSAANYLKQMATLVPEAAAPLNAAAALYKEIGDLTGTLWPWDHSYQGPIRQALPDGARRRELAGHVRAAGAKEAQAVECLEKALAILVGTRAR